MIKPLGTWLYDKADRLGTGGYAKVYACRGEDVDAAIKVFRDPTYALAFDREFKALAAVAGCPGTPALLDYGRNADGRLCLVFERASGVRLDKHLAENGPLDYGLTLSVLRQVLEILAHTHACGWLHKDLKSTNLLLDGERVTLLDWGLADPIGDGRCNNIRSRVQDAVAPECYYGRHVPATDFYSLGVLAIQLATGRLPFHLEDESNLDYRIVAQCFECPDVPLELGALQPLARNWLAKQPEQRLVGYRLDDLLVAAQTRQPDFSATRGFRQLGAEGGYLMTAARGGVPYAQHALADRLRASGHANEARHWYRQAANQGYARSCLALAVHSPAGDPHVEEWLRQAALAGLSSAQYRLSRLLEERESEKAGAAAWLQQAAENGDGRAQYLLARRIEKVGGDYVHWYGKAADRGHRRAQERLADCYHSGKGIAPDPVAAAYWRARATEHEGESR